jgi:hypothetical protein
MPLSLYDREEYREGRSVEQGAEMAWTGGPETTFIYADATGAEDDQIAGRM